MNSGSVISALDRKFLPQGQNFLFVRVIRSAQTSDNLYFGQRKLYFGPIKMAVLMKNGHFYLPKTIFSTSKGRERHDIWTFSLPLSTLFHLLGRYRKLSPLKMKRLI